MSMPMKPWDRVEIEIELRQFIYLEDSLRLKVDMVCVE
jgi:hypothetical protein